ncbi:MAG TPA: SoxR reducing system RseC family protein [Rhodocyclaceae bacterium]|nr:SoxR reducing system RseC family protein [Rhodocyclaceae bacterium]
MSGDVAWLEPEQTTSCGSCAAAATCGSKGLATVAARLERRRFAIANSTGLAAGDRVVVNVGERALLGAALLAYALPLMTMLAAAMLAHAFKPGDVIAMGAAALGLLAGLGVTRVVGRRLEARGRLAPRFVRRSAAPSDCDAR